MITLNDYCTSIDYNALSIELETLEIQQSFHYDDNRQERINELYEIMGRTY